MPRAVPIHQLARFKGTFVPLLVALLVVLVAAPLAQESRLVSAILVSCILIGGVFIVHDNRSLRRNVIIAFVIVLAFRWVTHVYGEEHRSLVVVAHFAVGMYLVLLAWICVAAVLRREQITSDTILGAICGYILIGYIFTFVYAVMTDMDPGSFNGSATLADDDTAKVGHLTPELLYFSFVTLTTVGYGDIAPASQAARSSAILEMLSGQLYLAAFVARLVGIMGAGTTGSQGGSSEGGEP